MVESPEHNYLVQQLFHHAASKWMVGVENAIFLDIVGYKKPPQIGDYRPDLYARHPSTNRLIIGEAETRESVSHIHAEKQIAAFLAKCAQEPTSVFLLAVPWYMRPYAKNLIRNIQREADNLARAVVIDELGS